MTRSLLLGLLGTVVWAEAGYGQDIEPRTGDYGFVATVDDARAIWLNPAGLAAFPEASVMAELVLDRPVGQSFELGQFTVGFNSRGFSFAYQRDRHPFLTSADAVRLGVGLGFAGGSVGFAVTSYSSNDNTERGADVGLRLDPVPGFVVGGAVRHIGRPVVRTIALPITGVLGASWTPVPGHVLFAGEAVAVERTAAATDGYDVSYRAGARLASRGRIPVGVLTAFDLGSNFKIDRWTLGLAVGGNDQLFATGSVVPLLGGAQHVHAASLTGVASRRVPGRQF